MYVVCVTFAIKPEYLTRFLPLMSAQAKNSLDLELDCFRFDVAVSEVEENQIFLYELYKDRQAFDDHLASKHFETFDKAVANMIKSKHVQTYVLI